MKNVGAVVGPSRSGVGAEFAVQATSLRKVYGPTTALAGVDLEVRAGEIHGLLGENGAGKSTIVRLLAGVESPDGGELRLFGEPAAGGPKERRESGLAFIHQDLGLFPEFSVAENIALWGGFARRGGLIDRAATEGAAQELLTGLGVDCDVQRTVGELPLADQTLVAVCRALASGARMIVLDEPTAYLEARQVSRLFDILARLRDDGVACILISHRTEEVLRVCDRVTVLRDGRTVATRDRMHLSPPELLRLITGRPDATEHAPVRAPAGVEDSVRLRVTDLSAPGFGPVSFELGGREVVGLCGLADAGQFAVGRALIGALGGQTGTLVLDGIPYRPRRVSDAVRAGVGFVPANRVDEGLAGSLTAAENILMTSDRSWWRPIGRRSEEAVCSRLLDTFRVRPPQAERIVSTFSGGNQQKVLLAKWLGFDRRLVVLEEPTAGVDVGATADIHSEIRSVSEEGATMLVISTDFQEIVDVCDRALVMRHGRLVAEVSAADLDADTLVDLAYGGAR